MDNSLLAPKFFSDKFTKTRVSDGELNPNHRSNGEDSMSANQG